MGNIIIDDEYLSDFKNGLSIWDIANKNNDTYKNAFQKIFGKLFTYKSLPKEEKDEICKIYLSGKSTVAIGKHYGTWNHTISNVLEERGIKRDKRLSDHKYTLDEHYFDEIDTKTKAYIFGFLLSDGSNNMKKQSVSISLQEEDKDILERMRSEIKSTKPLEFLDYSQKHDFGYNYKNQYRLLLFSKKICDALNKHGLVQNKSLVVEFQRFEDDLMSSFIRGMWDGDRTLGLYKTKSEKTKSINVSLVATIMFCEGLKEYLEEKLGVESCHIYDARCHNGVTKVLQISKNADKIKFLEWLYKDADIYLQRKYDKYLDIIDYYYNK